MKLYVLLRALKPDTYVEVHGLRCGLLACGSASDVRKQMNGYCLECELAAVLFDSEQFGGATVIQING